MFPQEKTEKVLGKFGEDISLSQVTPEVTLTVSAAKMLELATFLKEEPGMKFDFLIFVTAVDRKEYLEVVYGVRSMSSKEELLIKVVVASQNPVVPSVTSIWPAANWDEREMFDLFGITFEGHPNLKRILLPDNWEGHPLRKDVALTSRPKKVLEQ